MKIVQCGYTELHIGGVNPAIGVWLSGDGEVVAYVDDGDVCWDHMLWADAADQKVAGGWTNILVVPDARISVPTREALWRADCFEVLLEWINTELAPATHVGLWGEREHGTWAWLLRDGRRLGRGPPDRNAPDKLLPVHGWPDPPGQLDVGCGLTGNASGSDVHAHYSCKTVTRIVT